MYWLIAAVILVVLEMFVGTFYLLVMAAALASVGLTEWLFGTGTEFNLAMLAVLCFVGLLLARRYQRRRAARVSALAVNRPLDVGQNVTVEAHLHGNTYRVQYRGTTWQAESADGETLAAGQSACIHDRRGNTLIVRPSA